MIEDYFPWDLRKERGPLKMSFEIEDEKGFLVIYDKDNFRLRDNKSFSSGDMDELEERARKIDSELKSRGYAVEMIGR